MTTRIADPALTDTTRLLAQILTVVMEDGRVLFLCPAGESEAILNRVRMALSRQRQKMRNKGKRIQQFQLHSTVHPETHEGLRYDAIVLWRVTSKHQEAEMEMERLLALGSEGE